MEENLVLILHLTLIQGWLLLLLSWLLLSLLLSQFLRSFFLR